MKTKHFYFLLMLLVGMTTSLTSCGDDDPVTPNNPTTPTTPGGSGNNNPTTPDTPSDKPDNPTSSTPAVGWPAAYTGVMLQAFYWDGYDDAKWTTLTEQANEFAGTFDLVWLPQSGYCGGKSMGYDDLYWFNNYNSSFGNEAQLRSLISTFKQKNIKTIADVVINHRRNVTNWVDFPKETYNGKTFQLTSTDIVKNDDGGATLTWANQNGYQLSSNNDSGEGWDGMRDLDHKSENVQANVKHYLRFLLNDLGYAGFRYDMVKGYSATYTGQYNAVAQPEFSVGECWDGTETIRKWIDGTKLSATIQSAAFDFQFRYTVRNAANNGNWARLDQQNDGNWPLVSSKYENGKYRRYAVTFVENHDTERRPGAEQDPLKKDTLAANAYLLAMPGTPCVFLKHWLAYKGQIANMVAVRKAVGISNESMPTNVASTKDYYAVEVAGDGSKKLLCVVGTKADSYTPSGSAWKKVISGYHYVYYVQGIEPSAIKLSDLKDPEQPKDVDFAGIPSFCTVTAGEICAFFEASGLWGSTINVWAWTTGGGGEDYLGTGWPGVTAKLLGTADNGNKVYKWTSTQATAPNYIIFSNNGDSDKKTTDLDFKNGGYYNKDGLKGIVSAK